MSTINKRYNYLILMSLGLFMCLLAQSCREDLKLDDIDQNLLESLDRISNNQGVDFFKFPNSTDYNNIPQDPKNQLTKEKVALGQLLFHETGLGTKAMDMQGLLSYSCASCHHAAGGFQACRPQGIGEGGIGFGTRGEGRHRDPLYEDINIDVQPIRSPSAMNGAYQSVTLWNGQFGASPLNQGTEDKWASGTPIETNHLGYLGMEIQAIAGLKVHRLDVDEELLNSLGYKDDFDQIFADFPSSQRYSNETAGLAIAAFERTMMANQAPFQQWLNGDYSAMTKQEKQGALLFFDKANCASCHTGPALNTDAFHAIGLNDLVGDHVINSNPEDGAHLGRGGFTKKMTDMYKFKVPQLYNMYDSPFLGHGSSFTTIKAMVQYKNMATPQNRKVPVDQLDPLFVPQNLSETEIENIVAFLTTGLYDPDLHRYQPQHILSGQCFPNNDAISQMDLGCQ